MIDMRSLPLAFLFVLFFSVNAQAQDRAVASLSGTVTDAQRQPVPGANVFIAGSQRGTATDVNGHYRLDNVPLGVHRLVASIIGFETKAENLHLRRAGENKTVDFRMEEAVLELGQVTVESTEDVEWQRRYERFKRRFIGESPNAAETEILNPYVLNFSDRRGELKAEASEPLIIENYALGYRIRYDLTDFEARSSHSLRRWCRRIEPRPPFGRRTVPGRMPAPFVMRSAPFWQTTWSGKAFIYISCRIRVQAAEAFSDDPADRGAAVIASRQRRKKS